MQTKPNHSIRRLFVAAVLVVLTCLTATVMAASSSVLERLAGDWYDSNGSLVLSIRDGYINDCEVVDVGGLAGGKLNGAGNFRIVEGDGYRDLYLVWNLMAANNTLTLNRTTTLRRNEARQYYESVGGVYLGMSQQEVLDLYGQPQQKKMGTSKRVNWHYTSDKWIVTFDNGYVTAITILPNGTRRFDRTGYNCNNTPYDYAAKYGLSRVARSGANKIAKGEFLWFGDNTNQSGLSYVMLSVYNN